MIIDSVSLNNFISHQNTEIAFSGGINVLLGQNGAGKSSVMDAIRFALFGDSSRGNNYDLIHHGQNSCSVTLSFHVNEDSYEITRKISATRGSDSKTDAEMSRNGEIFASGAKSVTSSVESLFRISRELFFSSIFVKQGEIDQLVSEKPADRKRLFSQIIGIDELERKADLLKAIERRIRAESESFIVRQEDLRSKREIADGRRKELEAMDKEVEAGNAEFIEVSNALEAIDRDLDAARNRYAEMKSASSSLSAKKAELQKIRQENEFVMKKKDQYSDAEKEFNSILENRFYGERELLRSINSDMRETALIGDQLRELAVKLQQIRKMKEAVASLKPDYDKYNEQKQLVDRLEETVSGRKQFVLSYNSALSETRKIMEKKKRLDDSLIQTEVPSGFASGEISRDNISSELDALNSRKSGISAKIGSIESKISLMNSAETETRKKMEMLSGESACPVCGTELSPEHMDKVMAEYSVESENTRENVRELSEEREELLKEISELTGRISLLNSKSMHDYLDLKDQIIAAEKEIDSLSVELETGKEEFESISRMEDELRSLKSSLKDLEQNAAEYTKTCAALDALESGGQADRISALKEHRDPLEKRFRTNLEKLGIGEESVEGILRDVDAMEAKASELKPSIESLGKLDASIRENGVRIEGLERETAALEKNLKELPEVERLFQEIQAKRQRMDSRRSEIRSRTDSLKGKKGQIIEDLKQRELEISDLEARMEKYTRIQNAVASMSEIRAALEKDGIQKYLRKESSEAITAKTRSLVSEFGLEIDDIRVDEDFDVEVSVAGSVESLSSLSGGEKTALAIALRLSVADYVLSRVSTFIMDEPTTFLDEDRRGQLKNILQNSLRDQSIVPQLIVITHHQELTKAADMTYWVSKENGSSKVEPME